MCVYSIRKYREIVCVREGKRESYIVYCVVVNSIYCTVCARDIQKRNYTINKKATSTIYNCGVQCKNFT